MNLANVLSLLRVVLIPFFIISCAYYYHSNSPLLKILSLGIFIIAVFTDALDGYIARKNRQRSKLGSLLDPMADKLLLAAAFICLFFISNKNLSIELPIWLPITVISRDAILALGAVVIFMNTGHIDIIPSLWGKLTTIFQMATIIALFLEWRGSYFIWPVMIALTLISGIDYIIKGNKYFNESSNHRPA